MTTIGVLIGSLRKDSWTRKLALELIGLAPNDFSMKVIEIGGLPLYNPDLEDQPPQAWQDFRQQVQSCEGIVFVTPEYNRSLPGGLKNAIDVGSRPYAASAWDGKIGAVISTSPSSLGGFAANQAIRQLSSILNMYIMPQPESFYHQVENFFDQEDRLNEEGKKHLTGFITSYERWMKKMTS